MKRITLMLMLLAAFAVHAQKPIKPNTNKILSLWQEGKYAEAKEVADVTITGEKTQNDGKAWYHRGLVYATLDTIKDEKLKALAPDAFQTALESFQKAESLKGKSDYAVVSTTAIATKTQQMENYANYYLNRAIKTYQDEPMASLGDLGKARQIFEKHMESYVNDTLAYYVGTIVAAQESRYDTAVDYADHYIAKGGKSPDIYLTLYQIYSSEKKKDPAKALEVIRTAKKTFPNNTTFPRIEIEMLLNDNKVDEARSGLENAIKAEPNDKTLHYYLGYVNLKLEKVDDARKNFQESLRLDPAFYDAQIQLANTYLVEVDKVSKSLNALGNTAADNAKRQTILRDRVKTSETAIPYLEKAEKMKAPDKDAEIDLLNKLSLLYYYIGDDKNGARVKAKLKVLGAED